MTATAKSQASVVSIEALLSQQGDIFQRLLKESLQEVLEAAAALPLRPTHAAKPEQKRPQLADGGCFGRRNQRQFDDLPDQI